MTARKIGFEGSDGAGKATQTNLLVEYLEKQGMKVARVSFPRYTETVGGRLLYEVMKSVRTDDYNWSKVDPKVASMLYALDRKESEVYLNGLIEGNDVVIFDRYVESNLLHQGGKFLSDSERITFADWLFELEYNFLKLPRPDEIIYLTIPFWLSRKRAQLRQDGGGAKLDAVEKDIEYVKAGHNAGVFYANHFQWLIVNGMDVGGLGSDYELTPEQIHEKVKFALKV